MQSGTLSLTGKVLNAAEQIVDAEPLRFAMKYIGNDASGKSVFQMSIVGGARPVKNHGTSQPRNGLRFYLNGDAAVTFFNQLVLVFNPTPVLHPQVVSIATCDAKGVAGTELIAFDLSLAAQFPGNINLYKFQLTPSDPRQAQAGQSIGFNLTNTDGDGIVYLVDGLIQRNAPSAFTVGH